MPSRYIFDGTGHLAATERATQVAGAVVDLLNANRRLDGGSARLRRLTELIHDLIRNRCVVGCVNGTAWSKKVTAPEPRVSDQTTLFQSIKTGYGSWVCKSGTVRLRTLGFGSEHEKHFIQSGILGFLTRNQWFTVGWNWHSRCTN